MSITLAQLEQSVARRCGPFRTAFADRQVPTTATANSVMCPQLRSNIDLDSVTDLWLLRRNPSLDITDRQRQVATYDPETGRVYPDQPWGTIPVPGELFEFHHLDPDQELRPAVLSGLARCFFQDLVQVPPTMQYGGVDLTATCSWITEPWQVSRVQYGWWFPDLDVPFDVLQSGGHVVVVGGGFTYAYLPQTLWITHWRPHTSWVNGADSDTGPTNDTDTLSVRETYAAAAGHIEAWHLSPSRMMAAAAGGTQATQAMAAQEFSRLALVYGPTRDISIGFQSSMLSGVGI